MRIDGIGDDSSMATHDASERFGEPWFITTTAIRRGGSYELARPGRPDQRVVVNEGERRRMMVGILLELPTDAPLRGRSPTSMDALAVWGALTQSLQPRNLQAQLLTDEYGVHAVLVSRHLSGDEGTFDLRTHIADISAVIDDLAVSIRSSCQELVQRITERAASVA